MYIYINHLFLPILGYLHKVFNYLFPFLSLAWREEKTRGDVLRTATAGKQGTDFSLKFSYTGDFCHH